ncbi:MAG: hypothetical protein E7200_05170 [Selenomonas ruminantium]|nr:hypothetical protein [Selenomonas ruminantium]
MQKTEKKNDRTYIVTELCPNCGNEIEMKWNTDIWGYKAFCPVCGGRLMLCDECKHTEEFGGKCDYDAKSDSCMHNKAVNDDGSVGEKAKA